MAHSSSSSPSSIFPLGRSHFPLRYIIKTSSRLFLTRPPAAVTTFIFLKRMGSNFSSFLWYRFTFLSFPLPTFLISLFTFVIFKGRETYFSPISFFVERIMGISLTKTLYICSMVLDKETARKTAELLLQIKAIKLDPQQPFTWASG